MKMSQFSPLAVSSKLFPDFTTLRDASVNMHYSFHFLEDKFINWRQSMHLETVNSITLYILIKIIFHFSLKIFIYQVPEILAQRKPAVRSSKLVLRMIFIKFCRCR